MSAVTLRDQRSIVIHPLLENVGGSETVCMAVLKALRKRNDDICLLTSGVHKRLLDVYWNDIFRFVRLRKLRAHQPRPFDTYWRYLMMWKEITRYARDSDYVFLTQELLPGLSRFKRASKVLYVHFPKFHGIEDSGRGLMARGFLLPISRIVENQLNDIDMIICNSYFTKAAVIDLWGRYGIPDPTVLYPPTLREFDSSAGWEKRSSRALSIGRLVPFKRHEIMKQLALKLPDVDFVSAGSHVAIYDRYLRKLMAESPTNYRIWMGISAEDLCRQLETSKVYVHLAKEEHFGIAIVEAMSAGCVTFAHDSGGPREYLPEQLRWRDLRDLEVKIRNVMTDKDSWTIWHNRCMEISQKYGFDTFSDQLLHMMDMDAN
jgi:glycosyltransferase involved in cell wall biosynthesis